MATRKAARKTRARGWVLAHFTRGDPRTEARRLRKEAKAAGLTGIRLGRTIPVKRRVAGHDSGEEFNAFIGLSARDNAALVSGMTRLCGIIAGGFSHSEAYEIMS